MKQGNLTRKANLIMLNHKLEGLPIGAARKKQWGLPIGAARKQCGLPIGAARKQWGLPIGAAPEDKGWGGPLS